MDLLDFKPGPLYFDDPLPEEVEGLLRQAAQRYADGDAEPLLLRAYFLAPQQLTVLVGLYRFYFYQHRIEDARRVALRALAAAAARLGFPEDWHSLQPAHLGRGVQHSIGLVRFYLMALKALAFLHLRQHEIDAGCAMLEKLAQLDLRDRIGGRALLDLVRAVRPAAA